MIRWRKYHESASFSVLKAYNLGAKIGLTPMQLVINPEKVEEEWLIWWRQTQSCCVKSSVEFFFFFLAFNIKEWQVTQVTRTRMEGFRKTYVSRSIVYMSNMWVKYTFYCIVHTYRYLHFGNKWPNTVYKTQRSYELCDAPRNVLQQF